MRERGYSLFEFAIVVIVFALVLAVALQRMGFYQQAGEQAVVQAIQINLRTALSGKVLALQARGAEDQIAALAGANPSNGWNIRLAAMRVCCKPRRLALCRPVAGISMRRTSSWFM
jgi:type II secretory pathway pseudopilin PulG